MATGSDVRERNPAVLTFLVGSGVAFALTSTTTPPDPFSQLVALPAALAVALPAAYWLVYHRGYDGPDVSLVEWVVPVLVPVRLLLWLAVTVPLALLASLVAGVLPLPGPVSLGVETVGVLAALVAGQWVGFHGGWRAIRGQFGRGRLDATLE